jgi:hypothetical protein
MQLTTSLLHHHIIRHFVDLGYPPSVRALSTALGQGEVAVVQALQRLQDDHGVVLHPNTSEVWVAHPFAGAPTTFWVEAADGGWWANCAWCALGVVSLIGGNATVRTTLGGENTPVALEVRDGALKDDRYVVHFPVPMRSAWDNVLYTCSTMLLFAAVADVVSWCTRHNIPIGDVQSVATVLELARVWYGRHLDEDWVKWTAEEARVIFARLGLGGPIWELPASEGRF